MEIWGQYIHFPGRKSGDMDVNLVNLGTVYPFPYCLVQI